MNDRLSGKTIRWTFSEGQMKDRSFLHQFHEDGTVSFAALEGEKAEAWSKPVKCEMTMISGDVALVSYRVDHGFTLTVALNFTNEQLVAFSSNDKRLDMQRGSFIAYDERPTLKTKRAHSAHATH